MSCCNKREEVLDYYGKSLKTSANLKTDACKTKGVVSLEVRKAIGNIPDEILSKYYGCGLIAPDLLNGLTIIDLGCGSGRDCYVLSQMVGKTGHVVGIDMTEESLKVAKTHVQSFNKKMNGEVGKMEFIKCYLEDIKYESDSFDLAVSNCVFNLCMDKKQVLKECYRVLKTGGELYFSDVYCDKVISEEAKADKVLWGECLSGALIWTELFDIAKELGYATPRLFEVNSIELEDADVIKLVEDIRFVSVTYRLFKLDASKYSTKNKLVKYSENEGKSLKIDNFINFQPGESKIVDAELASILEFSRYKHLFTVSDVTDDQKVAIPDIKVNPFEYLAGNTKSSCCAKKKCC